MGNIKFTRDGKLVLELLFRTAFASDDVPPQFKYSKSLNERKLDVRRNWPQRLRKFPAIIISSSTGDFSVNELGPNTTRYETIDDDDIVTDVEYRGTTDTNFIVTILAGSPDDRDKLTDLSALFLRFLFRYKAAEEGFDYTKIAINGENQMNIDKKVIYTNSITIPCKSEFFMSLSVELIDNINNLDFEITVETESS